MARLWHEKSIGQAIAEYALILAVILVTVIGSITAIGLWWIRNK